MTLFRAMQMGLVLLCLGTGAPLRAQESTLVTLGKWQKSGKDLALIIPLAGHLTDRQKKLINSGFSTYSQLVLFAMDEDEEARGDPLFKNRCTVKYDTWEERYELARIDQQVRMETISSFDTYAGRCLTMVITKAKTMAGWQKNGAILMASLHLNQISRERADQIRDWLIKQQTGVVKGLFSHMLGELKLSEVITVTVHVPPYRPKSAADQNEEEVMAVYPEKKGMK